MPKPEMGLNYSDVAPEDAQIGCDLTEERRTRDRIRRRHGDLVNPVAYSERLRRLASARRRRRCRGSLGLRVLVLALVFVALTGCSSIAEGAGHWWDCWMDSSIPSCQEEGQEEEEMVGSEAAKEAVAAVYELSAEDLDAETRLADLPRPGQMTHESAVWAVLVHLYEVHGLARCDTQPQPETIRGVTVRHFAQCERVMANDAATAKASREAPAQRIEVTQCAYDPDRRSTAVLVVRLLEPAASATPELDRCGRITAIVEGSDP